MATIIRYPLELLTVQINSSKFINPSAVATPAADPTGFGSTGFAPILKMLGVGY